MDDVFSRWDVNKQDIDLFIEQANTFDPSIEFTTPFLLQGFRLFCYQFVE